MDYAEASAFFSYDPTTGELRRIARNHKAGKLGLVTSKDSKGYLVVVHKGRAYKGHRVAWLLATGEIPEGIVDHKNRDRADNRWVNLRLVSAAGNSQNCKVRADSASGVTGVVFLEHCKRWYSYLNLGGRRLNLGYYSSVDQAISARKAAELVYHPLRSA